MDAKTCVLMWRWSAVAVGLYALLWYGILPLFVSLPTIVGSVTSESGEVLFAFPVAISRLWDLLGVALFTSTIVYVLHVVLHAAEKINNDEVAAYLVVSLGFGLVFGLVFGLSIGLSVGLVGGLIVGLGVGLGFGLIDGLVGGLVLGPLGLGLGLGNGLGVGFGWGLAIGMVYGMPYGVGLAVAVALINGLIFLAFAVLRGLRR